jgi:di/tricarboxylate transporter
MKKTINNISEKIKEIGNKNDNELLIIGMISILIFIWIIVYLIPNIFVNLFNTFLGKIILILILMLVSFKNLNYGIILLLIFIIIYRFISLSVTNSKNAIKEGFTWNQTSKNDFLD